MNVVIYARYSSHNQTEQSIEGQLNSCHSFAEANDFIVIDEYIDRAKSGTTDNRPAFSKMIRDSAKGAFDGVIVYQLDRFARSRYDSAVNKHKLRKNGVRVISARENISDDASGVLMESVLEGMAEYYSKELSQKVKRGLSINASKHLYNGGSIPLGFAVDADKRFQVNPQAAIIVRKIFKMYIDGSTMAEIIRYLNSKNTRTSYGNEFNKNSIRNILLNKKYIGTYTFNDEETKDVLPRIVTNKTFGKVQKMMIKNKAAPARSRSKVDYLLTTKIHCGRCKSMMIGVSGTSHTGKKYCYYRCKLSTGNRCEAKNIPKEDIENLVINSSRKLLTQDLIKEVAEKVIAASESSDDKSEIRINEKMTKDLGRQRKNLFGALRLTEDDGMKESIMGEIQEIEVHIQLLKKDATLAKAGKMKLTTSEVKFFLHKIMKGDLNDQRYRKMLVDVLVNKFYVYEDHMIIYYYVNSAQSEVEFDPTPDISIVEGSFLGQLAQPILYFNHTFACRCKSMQKPRSPSKR